MSSQIHAPFARLSTLRLFLSVCNHYGLILEQFDVKNAFLNSYLREKVYMKIPEGQNISDGENKNNRRCKISFCCRFD